MERFIEFPDRFSFFSSKSVHSTQWPPRRVPSIDGTKYALAPIMLPRERIRTLGLSALTEPELLAVLLGTGPVSHNNLGAITLAETLLAELGDLNSVINTPWPVLERVSGMGTVKSCRIAAVGELLRRTRRPLSKTVLASAEDVFCSFRT